MGAPLSEVKCSCFVTDEKTWTTHYGAVEPASMWEQNPRCVVHSTPLDRAEADVEELRGHRNAVLAEMGATPANGFELDEDKIDRVKVEKAVILTHALKRAIEHRDALLP